jgi:hypothetical protein
VRAGEGLSLSILTVPASPTAFQRLTLADRQKNFPAPTQLGQDHQGDATAQVSLNCT